MWRAYLYILLLPSVVAYRFKPCPMLGATFQQPYNLSTDKTFDSVRQNLTRALQTAIRRGYASGIPLTPNITSFSIGVFDLGSSIISFQHTADASTLSPHSVKQVDRNSIYRIASVSKLFTVYLYLIQTGWQYWDRPVTEFLPHLADLEEQCDPEIDPLDCMAWSDITLGSLASHMAGIPRDYGLANFTGDVPPYQLGLPPPNMTAPEIECQERYACREIPYLDGLSTEHPTDGVYSQPIYSNSGFQILGYVFENITGMSFEDALEDSVLRPLGMANTTTTQPRNTTSAIIPGNATSSLWDYRVGAAGVPWVGMYSTQSDLEKAGRGILNSTLLSRASTRRWMKPVTHSATRDLSVGMPWEILRNPVQNRVVDQYTKSGDIGAYHSRISLLPDYGVGYVVLLAGQGDGGFLAVEGLVQTVSDVLLPGLETVARAQAQADLAGVYRAAGALNSSVTLVTDPDLPALRVARWISNGTDFLAYNSVLYGEPDSELRLYPMDLRRRTAGGTVLRSYRAVASFPSLKYASRIMAGQNCDSWVNMDGLPYNEVSLDEFLIETRDGRAISVIPRALDVTLARVAT